MTGGGDLVTTAPGTTPVEPFGGSSLTWSNRQKIGRLCDG